MSWNKTDERLIKLGMQIFSGAENVLNVADDEWVEELEEMNRKKGKPFLYPKSLISIASALHTILPLRQLSGAIISLFQTKPHYTTLEKRIKKESRNWEFRRIKGGILFYRKDLAQSNYFIDSTGFGIRRKGEWRTIRFKEKRIRKWYKLHKICDEKGEIFVFAITEQNVGDSSLFEELVKPLPEASKLYGDKAYFSRKNYKIAKKRSIEFHSPPKKNALQKWRSIKEFANEVKLLKTFGYEKWSEKTGYKKRFNKEFVFARLKLMFGENLRQISLQGVAFALLNRISLCNLVI